MYFKSKLDLSDKKRYVRLYLQHVKATHLVSSSLFKMNENFYFEGNICKTVQVVTLGTSV